MDMGMHGLYYYCTWTLHSRFSKKTRRPPDPLRPLPPYRTAAKATSWRGRPGHHLREGAKGLVHVVSRSYHYVLGWDKVWEDPPLPDPFTRGSNFDNP